jgi:TPR repeat protein
MINDTSLKLSLRSLVLRGAAAFCLAAVALTTGCASTQVRGASNAWSGKSTALDFYSDGCDSGDASACANAAHVALDPARTVHDDVLAAKFMTRACNASAYYCGELGQMYLTGRGVARDQDRGMSFIDRGCTAKNATACSAAQTSRRDAQLEAEKEKAKAAEAAQQAALAQAKDAAPATLAKTRDIKKTSKKGKPAKHK